MNTATPWYRQFWPWFLFGLPGVVVVAGLTTWWIAARHADHMVADDYYKEGLAINRQLGKQQLARELNIQAELIIENQSVLVILTSDVTPPALRLQLSHRMDASRDMSLQLAQELPGQYRTTLPQSLLYTWYWRLEPLGAAEHEQWRLDGEISLAAESE